jgi:hypothetical protein
MIPAAPAASFRVDVPEDDILAEARKRYQTATNFSAENREGFKNAIRFVSGAQWDDRLKAARDSQQRPCLTMDRLGTHINQVVNDQRQSKPAIKVHPVDDVSDVETAEIYNGVIRNIEHMSNAPMVYETASFTQVAGGIGAWRILTQYCDEQSFDQDIVLRRVLDPMSITFDPDAKEMDASDGMYAFVEERISKEAFKEQYPDIDANSWPSATGDAIGWYSADSVLIAEYYRVIHKPTKIYLLLDGSVIGADEFAAAGLRREDVQDERPAKIREVQWFKIAGNAIADSRVWPGKWIPLVRIVGNELSIEGKIVYSGLTQRAYDAQRMYNYQVSVMVEMLSLQKTAPFIGAKGQFKGQEQKWARANITNPAYLEYEPIDINGTLAPAPQRQASPQVPTGNVQAMQAAAQDLQWITGQHSANFGAQGNESSGRAIMARQREGDTATYHYLDNLSRGILHTGRILIDLIPKIMDSRQVLRTLGEDGTAQIVQQDPNQQEAMTEMRLEDGVKKIYNLGVGRYDVAVSVGPSFGTLRQEAVEAMSTLLQGNPTLWQAVGDLFVRNQNWPGAQEMADRLAKMVPPELKADEGEGSGDQSAQLQQALQQASQMLDQREQALQQAGQMIDQAQAEMQKMQTQLQQAKEDQFRTATDVASKTRAAEAAAEADIQVAQINAGVEGMKAMQDAMRTDVESLRKMLDALIAEQQKEESEPEEGDEMPEGPSPADVQLQTAQEMLFRIGEGQVALQEAAAALMAMAQQPRSVRVQRDGNGNIVGAVAQ